MTWYVLDTNIVSDVTKPEPSGPLVAWLARQGGDNLFLASLSVAEIRRGILLLPGGRRRASLEEWFDGPSGPLRLFAGRVLPFDTSAALTWAHIMAEGQAIGRTRSAIDMIVAATAIANGCVVATGNERHFEGVVPTINPLRLTTGG